MQKNAIIAIAVLVILAVAGGIGTAFAVQFAFKAEGWDKVTYYGNDGIYEGKDSISSPMTEAIPNVFANGEKMFVGWNTAADGSGRWIDVGENVTMGMSLYAQWSKYKLTINDTSFVFFGLNFFKKDASGEMQKITTFQVALDESGHDTIYFGVWDEDLPVVVIDHSITGYINGQKHICMYVFTPDSSCSMSADGKYVKMDLTYSDNISVDGSTRMTTE